jgi:hypothetical protein
LFAYRLALHLGEKNPDHMLDGMSASTFQEWQLYDRIEPFGEMRSELRHGQQMAMTANLNRDSKKRPQPFTALDFMNYIEQPEEKELTPEEYFEKIDKEIFGL